nr:hypothetical protein GCM10020092_040620 [Actinoplanes digitatis]
MQQAARQSLDEGERGLLRLAMARRLAGHRQSRQEAADQYLAVAGLIATPRERRVAAALLRTAGRTAAELTNYVLAEEFLAAAGTLLEADGTAADRDAVAVDRHTVLHCLGRLDEADEVYRVLAARYPEPITLATATCTQINSLAQRARLREGADLGLEVLRRFGVTVPADLAADVERATAELYRWAEGLRSPGAEAGTADDPRIVVTGRLINRLLGPAYLLDPLLYSWLVLQAHRLWARHGVCAPLVGTLGAAPAVTIEQRDDYRTGYRLTRYVIAVGEDRGYRAETALARYMYVALAAHWFEPLEDVVETAHQARDELLAAGDIQVACMTSSRLLAVLLDSAGSLDACAEELPPALAFAARTGNPYAALTFTGYQRLLAVLRGETSAPGEFAGPDFDEARLPGRRGGQPAGGGGVPRQPRHRRGDLRRRRCARRALRRGDGGAAGHPGALPDRARPAAALPEPRPAAARRGRCRRRARRRAGGGPAVARPAGRRPAVQLPAPAAPRRRGAGLGAG